MVDYSSSLGNREYPSYVPPERAGSPSSYSLLLLLMAREAGSPSPYSLLLLLMAPRLGGV